MILTLHTAAILTLTSAFGMLLLAYLVYLAIAYPITSKADFGAKRKGVISNMLQKWYNDIPTSLPIGRMVNKIMAEKVNGEAILLLLTPDIEKHVDRFLQEKMKEAFPMLYPLMGEKTIFKFKTAFMEEISLILPDVIQKLAASMLVSPDAQLSITPFLPLINLEKIQRKIIQTLQDKLPKLLFGAFFLGAALGLIQCAVLYFFN